MKIIVYSFVGFLYGIALAYPAFVLGGAGHGVFFPMAIFSSPLGLLSNGPAVMFGPPFLWCCVAGLLAATAGRCRQIGLLGLLAVHYLGIPILLAFTEWGDVSADLPRIWNPAPLAAALYLLVAFVTYVLGQAAIWFLVAKYPQGLGAYGSAKGVTREREPWFLAKKSQFSSFTPPTAVGQSGQNNSPAQQDSCEEKK